NGKIIRQICCISLLRSLQFIQFDFLDMLRNLSLFMLQVPFYLFHLMSFVRLSGFYYPIPSFKVRVDLRKFVARSEEHTSELQSRENLVCRLLLEKKKRHVLHKGRR